mgnify:CR=1 FL=1
MSDLNGLQKAAVLLNNLPPEVVQHMEPKQASRVMAELKAVAERPDLKQELSRVLDEATAVLVADQASPPKPPPKVDVRVGEVEKKLAPPPTTSAATSAPPLAIVNADPNDPLKALAAMTPEVLALALEAESTRTVALLMDRLEVDAAAAIYKRLSPAKRKEVSMRFTEQAPVGDDLVRRIALAVLMKCRTLAEQAPPKPNEQDEREKRMAGLLRGLERAERLEMLAALEQNDAGLAERLKGMLYQFEDILRMENISIQKMLSEIDMKTLAVALRGAPPEISDRITANLSRRAQESLKEEVELSGNVPQAKVREARKLIEDTIQRLDQREELVMREEA